MKLKKVKQELKQLLKRAPQGSLVIPMKRYFEIVYGNKAIIPHGDNKGIGE